MDEILERARGLGQALSEQPRFRAFLEASKRLQDDAAANETMQAYNKAVVEIARKEKRLEAVAVEEKRNVERLRQAVASHPTIKAFMRAQADYMELMRRVNDAIYGQLVPPPRAPAAKPQAPSPRPHAPPQAGAGASGGAPGGP